MEFRPTEHIAARALPSRGNVPRLARGGRGGAALLPRARATSDE